MKIETVKAAIENRIAEEVWAIFEDKVCPVCRAVRVERGARTRYGLQITPDELTCPAEYEPDEPTCIHARAWAACEQYIEQMAEEIEAAIDD